MTLLDSNFAQEYTISNPGTTTYTSGRGVLAGASTYTVNMSVQQASLRELAVIKDINLAGRDFKGVVKGFSDTDIPADHTFEFYDQTFTVVSSLPRVGLNLDHFVIYAILE
jgi:hypothetical protein